MESWSYACEEKDLVDYAIDSASDPLSTSKHPSFVWESRNPSRFNENIQLNKISNNSELKLPNNYQKKSPDNPICCISDLKVRDLPFSNAFLGEDVTSKLSPSVVGSNNEEFPLSDLKLGRFADSERFVHLSESVSPKNRARVSKLNLQIAFCQVHGCNQDLSSSKDYYKKHKVCESHTKTAKVIVNGIEQRFCQQCSRFHLVDEFDDAKRSCRRRLAGHNERRRKPRVGLPSRNMQRFLQSYESLAENVYPRTTSSGTSLIFQDSGFWHSKRVHGMNDWFKRIEVEDKNSFTSSVIPLISNGRLNSKLRFSSNDVGAQNWDYPFDMGGFYSSPLPLLPHNSSASEVFDADPMFHDLRRMSNSGCAHSLLSSFQPHNSSYHFSGLSMLFREASTSADQCQTAFPVLASENHGNSFQIDQGVIFCLSFFKIIFLKLSSQFQLLEDQKAATSGLA